MKQNDIKDNSISKLDAQNLENLFNVYQLTDGTYFYNITKTTNFPTDLDPNLFTEYVVVHKDVWPTIAWKHYKDVRLWWLVCAVNHIKDPTKLPEPGAVIKMLRPDVVRSVLSEIKDS